MGTPALACRTRPPRGRARIAGLALGVVVGLLPLRPAAAQNVLLVLLDDVGVDKIGAYSGELGAGPTPVIDGLAAQGVAFRNAAAMPLCSPTRVAMLTGNLPHRTGVGDAISWGGQNGDFAPDPQASVSLPELVGRAGWSTACVGKWHMSLASEPEPFLGPLHWGFDIHVGPIANLSQGGGDYFAWSQNTAVGGVALQAPEVGYATTRQVDDALAVIDHFGETPWFVWLALNAPHKPLHAPPAGLHSQGELVGADLPTQYRAVLEAADTELGRLLDGLPQDTAERTFVVLMGDNGTYLSALEPPFDLPKHHKSFVYEGGVNVPLIVTGPGVVPGWSDALVTCTDVYATVAELLGLEVPPGSALDGRSFVPSLRDPEGPGARRIQVTQMFGPNGFGAPSEWQVSARDARFKYLVIKEQLVFLEQRRFFDLSADPLEQLDLLGPGMPPLEGAALASFTRLSAVVAGYEP